MEVPRFVVRSTTKMSKIQYALSLEFIFQKESREFISKLTLRTRIEVGKEYSESRFLSTESSLLSQEISFLVSRNAPMRRDPGLPNHISFIGHGVISVPNEGDQ